MQQFKFDNEDDEIDFCGRVYFDSESLTEKSSIDSRVEHFSNLIINAESGNTQAAEKLLEAVFTDWLIA